MSEQIRDRIRKLLNMTVANGCTEDEQETALRMASAMAIKAGIELDALRAKDAPKIKVKAKVRGDEMKPHQALCAIAAATLYGVECNVYNLGKEGVMFVGREELIELAEETMFWLFRQVESLYSTALPKGMTKSERAEFRRTFKAACAERARDRAYDYVRQIKNNQTMAQEATGHNALVVKGHFETLQSEIDAYWTDRYTLTPEQEAAREKRLKEYAEKEAKWRAENPEEAARLDKEQERLRKKEERAAARRKGRKQRELPRGNGTKAGWAAGDQVKLRKEVE